MPPSLVSYSRLVLALVLVSRVASLQCSSSNITNDYTPEPSSLNDGIHSLVTVNTEEARVAALCHVTCINYLLRSLIENGSGNSIFPSPMPSPPSPASPIVGGEVPSEELAMIPVGKLFINLCS